MATRSGFAGERMSVLPRGRVAEALESPLTSRLVVTDCGYFPHATDHERSRAQGSQQAIIIVCVEGEGWCRLDGVVHEVRAGDVLVIPARTPHSYGARDSSPWTVWWMHVEGVDVPALVEAAGISITTPVLALRDVGRAVSLVDEALSRWEADDPTAELPVLAASGAAWHLLTLLAASRHERAAERLDPVAVAIAHLQVRWAAKLSVAELASVAGLSTSHFAALFRNATGCGVHAYQTRLRMARSRELLDTTDLPISVIARRVGYSDPFYFSRQFRAVHGVTASQYREQDGS